MRSYDDIPRLLQLDVAGRRVFLMADLDGPRSPYGAVLDDVPLRVLLPTLRALLGERAKVIVGATFQTDASARTSSAGVASRLGDLLGAKVGVMGKNFVPELRFVAEGQVVVTPNLAAIKEAADDDPVWVAELARSVDVYVLEGLRAAYGASTVSLSSVLPARGVGPLVGAALDCYKEAALAPQPPYTLVLGGPSVRRLAPLLRVLFPSCADVLLGGGVANTFLVAQGWNPAASPYEADGVAEARNLLALAAAHKVTIHSPVDAVVRSRPSPTGPFAYDVRPMSRALAPDEAVVDVAVATCVDYRDVLVRSTTAVWIGLMGDCSMAETQAGSMRVGQAVGEAKRAIVAGDDTSAGVVFFGLDGRLRVMPGGDAALALLADETFPGLESLRTVTP